MSKEKLRGIIGSVVVIVFATLALAFLALPICQAIAKSTISSSVTSSKSVFELLGHLSGKMTEIEFFGPLSGLAFGESMRASLVMFLLVAIVSCLLIVLAIVHLVGVILGNKKLNMTLLMQALSVGLVVLSLLGLILCCAGLPKSEEVVRYTAQAGSVLPLVMSMLIVVGAFVLPWHKLKKTS